MKPSSNTNATTCTPASAVTTSESPTGPRESEGEHLLRYGIGWRSAGNSDETGKMASESNPNWLRDLADGALVVLTIVVLTLAMVVAVELWVR